MDGARDIRGYKGGGSEQAGTVESPDNLQSIAYAHVLDAWCEGEIRGFVHPTNVLQDVALNGTPAANSDGSLNFKNVQFDSRAGSQGQVYMSGFPDVENEIAVGVELKSTTPWTQTLTNLQLSAVRVTLSVPAITQQDASSNQITGYTIQYAIDVKTDSGAWQQAISSAFTGKSTSKYQRQHKIDLPPATTGWTIRVRRLTANQNKVTVADTTTVDSYAEIIDAKFRYPNTAYGGLVVDSSQFSSIPTRAYNLYGRIVQIPSNYDPDTRTYTGTWDGTFKPGWTNNPAWMFYDVAVNDRFGLGQYMPVALVDKWVLYTIAQYCDELVPDGFGGMEPRFWGFVYLRTQADAFKAMSDLASMFRGVNYWAGGSVHAVADMPADPDYTYNATNVIGGKFTYSGSARKTRYTVALVSWNDPDDFGRAKVEYVNDDVGIARYGVQITQVAAFGAMSRGVARRMGRGILLSSRLQTEMVSFQVGLDGTLAVPGQIIRVADPARAGKRQGGRIRSATVTQITLDHAPGQAAVGDSITCTLPSGVTETHGITAISGNVISVASPGFSTAPGAESAWIVESANLQAALYRVVGVADDSVTDDEGNSKIAFTISALQHNASKYDAIDFDEPISVAPISLIPPSVQPGPDSVTITSVETSGAVLAATLLTIQWPATQAAVRYQCEYRKDNGDWQSLGDKITGLSVDIHSVQPGTYVARVRAFNASHIGSVPTQSASYTVDDQTRLPTKLSDIQTEVDNAAADAKAANDELQAWSSDGVLSPAEKPAFEHLYAGIADEQAGIDAQANAYGITTEKSDYDNAISTLNAYLNTLTTPVDWNNKSGTTTITGSTFLSYFNAVYSARQTLLNAIYAAAKKGIDANQPLIRNPNFATGDLTGWTVEPGVTGWGAQDAQATSPNPAIPTYVSYISGSAANTALRNKACNPCQAGDVVTATCQVACQSGGGNGYVRIIFYNSSSQELAQGGTGNKFTGTASGTSRATATAPAGAVYFLVAPAVAGYTTGVFRFTAFTMSLGPRSMDEVPDSSTRFAAVEAGADRTSGKSMTVLTDRNLDNIEDSPTYLRTTQLAASSYALQVDNATFQNAALAGWTAGNGAQISIQSSGITPAIGSQFLRIDAGASPFGAAFSLRHYACSPGDRISVGGLAYAFTGTASIGIAFYDASSTFVSSLNATTSAAAWTKVSASGAVPSGATYFLIQCVQNSSNGIALFNYVWCATNDLRMPGSGQRLGDQGNAPASLTSSLGMVRSATALTAFSTGAVNVNAHTVTYGPRVVPYNAVSNAVTGLAQGSGYYIYARDNGAGGSPTWNATTSAQVANGFDDGYNAGYVTIPTSGSSGGGGSGGAGSGGGSCVCADMWLWPLFMAWRGTLTAGELARRWRWWKPWLWFLRGPEGWHLVRRRPRIVQEYCVRPIVEDGSHVDCSVHTPVTTRTGQSVLAPHLYGHGMATDSGWQRVTDVQALPGSRDVVRICVGGNSFFSSADKYRFISTHNIWKP